MSWVIAVFAVLLLVLSFQLLLFERGRPSSRSLALIAALSALAIAGRLAFAPLPNIKPTTVIIMIAGLTLGAAPGFAVGAITALVSNMFFGQGPWTPWQMFAWGLVGIVGAGLGRATGGRPGRWTLAITAVAVALMFGLIMDVSQWVSFAGQPRLSTLVAYMATSLPWNLAHAAGSAVFALAFGPLLIRAVKRVTERAEPHWLPRGASLPAIGLPALIAAVVLSAGAATKVAIPAAQGDPVGWLVKAQNGDGGFGRDVGVSSSGMETAWTAMALASGGRDLATLAKPGGLSVSEHLMGDAGRANDAASEERVLLAASAAAGDPGNFGGRDLKAAVARRISSSGSVDSQVNLTAFAILSLRSAGVPASDQRVARAARWLRNQQQDDGGFGFMQKGASSSDVDDTAAAVQALAAVGGVGVQGRNAAVRFIRAARSASGGYPQVAGGVPNAQSTAWAIQGLIALRPSATESDIEIPSSWLRGLIGPSGAVAYSKASRQTPVWVTAQAVLALNRQTLLFNAPIIDGSNDGTGGSGYGDAASGARQVDRKLRARRAAAKARKAHETAVLRDGEIQLAVAADAAGRIAGALARSFAGGKR